MRSSPAAHELGIANFHHATVEPSSTRATASDSLLFWI
jgi:hypothetical protein